MNLIKIILSFYYWNKAINLIEDEEDFKAYEYLNKIDNSFIEKYYYIEYNLLYGFNLFSLYRSLESEKVLKNTIEIIKNDKHCNKDEKMYLQCYALKVLKGVYIQLNREEKILNEEITKLKSNFKVSNIRRKILLRLFPIDKR